MKATYSTLMNSRFFNPAFNSAIFDGPVRIYFAQFHESMALKIYFSLQQKFPQELSRAKENYKRLGSNVLVMLYPSVESFQMSFEEQNVMISQGNLLGDSVIGINGPFEDDKLMLVLETVVEALRAWDKEDTEISAPPFVEALP
jgi:hypothetical protein